MRSDEVEKIVKQKHMAIRVQYDPNGVQLPGIAEITITNGLFVRHMGIISNGIPVRNRWPLGVPPERGFIGGRLGPTGFLDSLGIFEAVEGFWAFDKDMKLIDVFVYKHYNGL